MKLDDRKDALNAARRLVNAQLEQIADALLEAHLEGLQQARGQLRDNAATHEVTKALEQRCNFIRGQLSTHTD